MTDKIITIEEIHKNVELYEEQDKVNYLLNQPPPAAWVKNHPTAKGVKYIPIDKIEYLLRNVIRHYRIEVLRESVMFNAVSVAVRVHYKDLITGEWSYHDGVGAASLQTDKGAHAADMNAIKQAAVEIALPKAKTQAIKDACDHFGKLFGSDLNRKDTLDQKLKETSEEKLEQIKELMNDPTVDISEDVRIQVELIIENEDKAAYAKALRILKSHKK